MKIGISTGTFLIFLTLKLCHVINWPWLWVTAPLWGYAALIAAILLFSFVAAVIFDLAGMKVVEK